MPNNMPDTASILSPTGAIFAPNWTLTGVNGTNSSPGFVFPDLPGKAFGNGGQGEYMVSGVSGRQGTLQINLTTGAAGSARAVAFLWVSATVLLGVALDSSNRPYAILKNMYGATVGQSAVSPVAIGAGVPLEIILSWDSQGMVFAGRQAGMMINGSLVDWSTSPTAPWSFLVPSKVLIGTSLAALGLNDFVVGVIGSVQIGNQVVFTPSANAPVAEGLAAGAALVGNSTVTPSARVTYAADATMSGSSSVGADANLVGE